MENKWLAVFGVFLICVLVIIISQCGTKTVIQKTMKCDCVEVQ